MKGDNAAGIRLVIFDLGRVLIRICDDWRHACRRAGITVNPDKVHSTAQSVLENLAHRSDIGQIDLTVFVEQASPVLGLTPDELRMMSHAFLHGAFPGVEELIDDLTRHGVATACLSNTNESHWRIMNDPAEPAHLPLDRLTHRFASHLAGVRKPDPAIYAHVERETGISPPAILFFDDLADNIEAALRRGWNAVRVDPRSENPIPAIRLELVRRGVLTTP